MNGTAGRNSRLRLVQPAPAVKRRRPLKVLGVLLLFLGTGALLFKTGEAFCKVEQITVAGAARFTEAEIIARSGIKKGTSLFLLRTRQAEKELAALPGLCAVEVKRAFPSTACIRVQERQAAASLLDQDRFWLIDCEGVPFAEQPYPEENLPVITGAAAAEISIGKHLDNRSKSDALRTFLQALSHSPLEPAELNISDPGNLVLYTMDGSRVMLGNSDQMIDKLALLWSFLQQGSPGKNIDLRTGDRLVVAE